MSEIYEPLREAVLCRDRYECVFCGITQDEHREKTGQELAVHHIIPENYGGKDELDNLVTVCSSCHRPLEEIHAKAMGQMYKQGRREREDLRAVLDRIAESCREAIRQHNRGVGEEQQLSDFDSLVDGNGNGTEGQSGFGAVTRESAAYYRGRADALREIGRQLEKTVERSEPISSEREAIELGFRGYFISKTDSDDNSSP